MPAGVAAAGVTGQFQGNSTNVSPLLGGRERGKEAIIVCNPAVLDVHVAAGGMNDGPAVDIPLSLFVPIVRVACGMDCRCRCDTTTCDVRVLYSCCSR